jgi:hypothetical protein
MTVSLHRKEDERDERAWNVVEKAEKVRTRWSRRSIYTTPTARTHPIQGEPTGAKGIERDRRP